ncbi:hypothetical protein N5J43_08340 [Pseudomonas nicosulfuronedens]|uniref:hypothetical protein n=1 Tax=Pseudomonas nicosulfuronedens TaxID=2571105 RepID=UPI0024484901|nr:hypothetical protein [Pseudomonas nicosulfuronedens]MDH1009980.1 hypothetical protein [Pseudomonas nicosulfuronedens]MDH1978956.1 hypothetical protein [Pseudomonas nicosulfuronedens]MDH2028365.1 hypothetical protein [Pseudomonas nicosulfuronedens]
MQLTLNFEAGLADSYPSCREYVAARVHQQGRQQKSIAADMDLSPSQLTRKLAQSPGDSCRFTLDDFESFIASTGDKSPVLYLVEKYLAEAGDEIAALERRLEQLRAQKGKP